MKRVDKSGGVKKAPKKLKRRIFLDHASTTPLDRRAFAAMIPYLKDEWGNPSALYKEGVAAKRAVALARVSIARLLNVRSEEIIFTASGTEADNLAILGVFDYFKKKPAPAAPFKPHIVTTNIEHPGILEACREIEKHGGEVTYVPVEENGIVDPKKIKAALRPNTVLVSVMYANNEIGTIQPLREISRVIQEFKNTETGKGRVIPYFHTDASQAANYLTISFQALGVDMMTLDASKIYGPKGVGLLAVKRNVPLQPIIFGGGQEKGLRSGTENVAGMVGMACALEIADKMREKESERLTKLRDYFFAEIKKNTLAPRSGDKATVKKEIIVNGDPQKRLPNNINICIPGLDAEFAVIKLDQQGIACSSASSCLNLSENSYSYVVQALGKRRPGRQDSDKKNGKNNIGEYKECRESSLRFTLGRATKKAHIDRLLSAMKELR